VIGMRETGRSTDGAKGSATGAALLACVALSLVFLSGAALAVAAGRRSAAAEAESELRRSLTKAVEVVRDELADPPDPARDLPSDPVWRLAETGVAVAAGAEGGDRRDAAEHGAGPGNPPSGGPGRDGAEKKDVGYRQVTITLAERSSRINPNWAGRALFERTRLDELFLVGTGFCGLQEHREREGLFHDGDDGYLEFFDEETIARYLTVHSYAHIDTADEFALRRLYAMNAGKRGVEAFRARVQSVRREARRVEPSELRRVVGREASELLVPPVTAEPQWNLHFLPELILREILAYDAFELEEPGAHAAWVLDRRDSEGVDLKELRRRLELENDHRLFAFLGTRSWFWEVRAEAEGMELHAVLARVPVRKPGEKEEVRVVERRFRRLDEAERGAG